jgi:Fur family transcriptional regulator, ferric uptake regulator
MEIKEKEKWYLERLDRYLVSQDLKQTRQRRLVVKYFLNSSNHTDAESLYRRLQKDDKNVGLATIYRTLNLLKTAHLAVQHNFSDGRAVFEPLLPNEHHDHLICLNCNVIVEFINDTIEKLQVQEAEDHGFVLQEHRLDLFGYCKDCKD